MFSRATTLDRVLSRFESRWTSRLCKRSLWKDIFRFGGKRNQFDLVLPQQVSNPLTVPEHIQKPSYWDTGTPEPKFGCPEVKSDDEIARLKRSCQLAGFILNSLDSFIKTGITTDDIDKEVHRLCIDNNAYPSPLNYRGFPKSCCTSVNNVICHGIPDNRQLVNGDIINVDVTIFREGVHGDCSKMFLIGQVDEDGKKLCDVTKRALEVGIDVCGPGVPYSLIGETIEDFVTSQGFVVMPSFMGHGIGTYFHGPPEIFHFRYARTYPGEMEPGVAFTIEPAISEGSREAVVLDDEWTVVTQDSSRAAQWEHTVLITESGVETLT